MAHYPQPMTLDEVTAQVNAQFAAIVEQARDALYRLSGEPEFHAHPSRNAALWSVIATLGDMQDR